MAIGTELLVERRDLRAFAAANGWRHDPVGDPPALGDDLWEQVSNGTAHDLVTGPDWQAGRIMGGSRTASRRERHFGLEFTTTVTSSTPKSSIDVGYLAIRLPRHLPNLVMDARSNDPALSSSLIRRPKLDQRLPLEGDFDRHFHLYAPKGYERDALYVFTPDLMALLIDETGDLDVEVRDDVLMVMKPGGFVLTDPATWERFERIRAVVGGKFHDRTDRYVDGRAAGPDPVATPVAPAGRRLRHRMSRTTAVALGFAIGGLAVAALAVVIPFIVMAAVL